MSEFGTTIAAPFKKNARQTEFTRTNLVYFYALDRKWMSTEQAKKLIETAETKGLLRKDEKGNYTLSEALAEEKIPLGFRPSDAIFAADETEINPVEALLDELTAATGKTKKDLAAEMQEISAHFENLILPEAAVILLAKKYRMNSAKYAAALQQRIKEQ